MYGPRGPSAALSLLPALGARASSRAPILRTPQGTLRTCEPQEGVEKVAQRTENSQGRSRCTHARLPDATKANPMPHRAHGKGLMERAEGI